MPRTKVSKNSKRNREVTSREEKLRTFEIKMESFADKINELGEEFITQVDNKLKMMTSAVSTKLLNMKLCDFFELELSCLNDFKASDQTIYESINSQSVCNTTTRSTVIAATRDINRNDEGYLTEDSSNSSRGTTTSSTPHVAYTSAVALNPLRSTNTLRTPGPLHSARARRGRRSRSACSELDVPGSAKPNKAALPTGMTHTDRSSRNKLRTPMSSRSKAFSADRAEKNRSASPSTPPMAFLRWPKPGEVALSKCGTPIVAQVMPDKFANVNIPVRNGVLSLRPKKLAELSPDLIEAIDSDTLHQIKTLHENLNLIVNLADKAGRK